MELKELLSEIAGGEQTTRQFKVDVTSPAKLAAEMVAFSNSEGGKLFIGVDDKGVIVGLSDADVRRLNLMVSDVCSQHVRPAINAITENVVTDRGTIMVVSVPQGLNRPYQDKDGTFWVKSGSDKRKATSREELQRMFQAASLVHADEVCVRDTTEDDIDTTYFLGFVNRRFGSVDGQHLGLLLKNLNLGDGIRVNTTGLLLFGRNPSRKLPMFIVKAGAFPGKDLVGERYDDSTDISGRLADVYAQTVNFIMGNIYHGQAEQGVNSLGEPEIPRIVFEELVANALIHRDYFVSAPVRVFVFSDRVEIISPGHLPNNLTVDNIRLGNTNARNPVLASFANHIIPYRGYGGGIMRAYAAYPAIELVDDREGNMFKAVVYRFRHRFGDNNIPNLFHMNNSACVFSRRFDVSFSDVANGSEIVDRNEIYERLSKFFGGVPAVLDDDAIWWTRGLKALQIQNVCYDASLGAFYFGRLECCVSRLIPFRNRQYPERSFIYLDIAAMPQIGDGTVYESPVFGSWKEEAVSFYRGRYISEDEANDGAFEDENGDCVDMNRADLFRFTRFLSNQNILITAKPFPCVRDEQNYGRRAWTAMDDILQSKITPFDLRSKLSI